ncbi:2-oxoglutarate and iron-dependent oxygenase domain-containing protein 3-like [Chironomus tepperi]|uniref:2-oxoglutarate and iron-dependent oxygenase domain-containing protein 3-like n=1 Tax=Chironomus tepperi TaxID=113505 RepID=UPI00391F72EF
MSTLTQRKVPGKAEDVSPPAVSSDPPEKKAEDRSAKFKTHPPQLKSHKVFVRIVLAGSVFAMVYFMSNKEKTSTLAGYKEDIPLREHKLICSADSFTEAEFEKHPKCISACKRFVTDNLMNENEIEQLQELARKLFQNHDESSEIYHINSNSIALDDVTKSIHDTIKSIQPKIIENIAQRFEISHNLLYITSPTYFSKITNITTEYSESMHRHHYDKEIKKNVHYTVIIFLSNYKRNFHGGRFIFVEFEKKKKKNHIVDPKAGRVVVYSAGGENTHVLENILNGNLVSLTLSFTCEHEETTER